MSLRRALPLLFLLLAAVPAWAQDLATLQEAFRPVTTASQSARWVTLEASLELPLAREEHLLAHYLHLFDDPRVGVPDSFDALRADFDSLLPEKSGFPLLSADGRIEEAAARFWIERHLRFHHGLAASGAWRRIAVLGFQIDPGRSTIDEERGLLRLVYRVRLELEPAGEGRAVEDYDFAVPLPRSIHDLYYEVLGAAQARARALELLSQGALPRPYLAWKRALTSVKHPSLGEEAVPGILDLPRFLEQVRPLDAKFYPSPGSFAPATVVAIENPARDVEVHPEYHELLRDRVLTVLFALQACNHRRYTCGECEEGHASRAERLRALLADHGYRATEAGETVSRFRRQVGDLEVRVTVLDEVRPVYYETSFWQHYPGSEIVFTNRVPILSDHFWRIYSPSYQVLLAPGAGRQVWGRILPQLDYAVRNFDAVELDVDRTPPEALLEFLETIVQQSEDLRRGDGDWRTLLAGLEGEERSRAIAHYVRGNRFDPAREDLPYLDFSRLPPIEDLVSLLNVPEKDLQVTVAKREAYLYLTLRLGDECADLAELRDRLMRIGRDEIADSGLQSWYFFARDFSPRALLASERMPIHGIHFARGSYLELYFGQAAVPKAAYLADTTRIGRFLFKAYYQDNGGVVRFHRKTGRVREGHLAADADERGFPLLGGKGTAMVRFHEDGSLESAQLREDVSTRLGGVDLLLRGGWRGPHQIRIHPSGAIESAYLAEVATIRGMAIDSVPAAVDGERIPASAHKRVSFHANGELKSGVLARPFEVEGTTYPAGTRVVLNNAGRIVGPVYQTMGEGEYYWNALFPAGSLYQVEPSTSNPAWIRLAGELRLRNHSFPAGTEIAFTADGGLRMVRSGAAGRPRIVLADYSISVPEGATLRFDEWSGEPSDLVFSTPITIGDLTFLPEPIPWRGGSSLAFHGNGRVERGVLGADAVLQEQHYGEIPLAAGTPVAFTDDGTVREGTLAEAFLFSYRILDPGEIPRSGEVLTEEGESRLGPIRLPAGTRFALDYQSKLRHAVLDSAWEGEGLVLPAGGELRFDDALRVAEVSFPEAGGRVGEYAVGAGRVAFHACGRPAALVLSADVRVGELSIPSGARVTLFPSGKVQAIETPEGSAGIAVGGRAFTREVEFGADGRVRRGYLLADETYHGVRIAGLERCRLLRFASAGERAGSCAVTFYPDGVCVLRAVAAETFEHEGRSVRAGQPIEFDEEGRPFLE